VLINFVNRNLMININNFNFKFKVINTIRLNCLIRDELKIINFFNVLYILNAKVNLLLMSQIINKKIKFLNY